MAQGEIGRLRFCGTASESRDYLAVANLFEEMRICNGRLQDWSVGPESVAGRPNLMAAGVWFLNPSMGGFGHIGICGGRFYELCAVRKVLVPSRVD